MNPESQSRLSELLDRVFGLPELAELQEDRRMRRIHYDWIAAGEQTQRTVARLSQQLRRFLDNQSYLEHRRIMELLDHIGKRAVAIRDTPPKGTVTTIAGIGAETALPLERPLYTPPPSDALEVPHEVDDDEREIDLSALFGHVAVDTERLRRRIRALLAHTDQISLSSVVARNPLTEGLAELVGYLSVASSDGATVDDEIYDRITWVDAHGITRRARVPRVIFTRTGDDAPHDDAHA